ncbi:MAG: polyprenyl synthetase family protein [Oscillospiraceae bacterium]
MDFEKQHALYLSQCEVAIKNACAQLFQAGSVVSQAAEYSLMNGGKRVRGVLTLAVCGLLGGNRRAAERFAAALEMLHAFSLIHDDLPCMDNSDTRRGKPSCHVAFGEATALLAGDLLVLEAFELAAGAEEAVMGAEAARTLARAAGARGMIYGQELDMYFENHRANEVDLHQIHANKTGALLCAAVQLGSIAAGHAKAGGAILEYAQKIGLVFQIVDDILDVTAEPGLLGKPVGNDEKSGKATFVTVYGLQNSRQKAKQLTEEAISAVATAYGAPSEFLTEIAKNLLQRAS